MDQKSILLVDDTNLILQLEKSFLSRSDIRILTARDGLQALEVTRQEKPDVIFMDLNMPVMDGLECCRLIKSDPELKHISVVMVTTEGRPKDLERCQSAGCNEILLKPINRTEFVQTALRFLALQMRSERFKATLQIHYGTEGEKRLTDFSVDISSGGLFINTEHPLTVDEDLTLSFTLPNPERQVLCSAQVAWVNSRSQPSKESLPPGMGIRFVDLSIEDLHAIRNYLSTSNLEPSW